ncbi:MAG: hypothetical protein WC384_17105 [Prolixibacteraceae bacterium]|jgi:hypothetical protein
MKKIIFILFLFANFSNSAFSQVNGGNQDKGNHEVIQQVETSGLADILSFQTMNNVVGSFVEIQQVGNQNRANISQQTDAGSAFANQVYSIQQGNSNEMTVGQIGSSNLLLGLQLGYATNELDRNTENRFGLGLDTDNAFANGNESKVNQSLIPGEGNELKVDQLGNNNAVVAVQQGSENSIEAGQNGTNNYLVIYQKGKNNEVIGYKQENNSANILTETIIQQGEGNILNATDVSRSKPNGNSFIQNGVNLSLEVNNQFTNTLGGIEVSQTGHDMKVVVDQSFFSFPTR